MNLRRLSASVALLGCLSLSSLARADDVPAELLPFTAQGQAAAQKHWAALKAAGLGDDLVGDRVREWQSKGADEALVLSLLGKWAVAALEAREVVDALKLPPSPELSALVATATAALVGGAGREPLSLSLQGSRTTEEVHARVLALTTLMSQGFPSEPAAQAISAAGGRGFLPKDLTAMTETTKLLVREGAAPSGPLLNRMTEFVNQGIAAKALYPTLQRALGPGRAVRPITPEAGYNHYLPSRP